MKRATRFLSILLTLCMLIGIFPMAVSAQNMQSNTQNDQAFIEEWNYESTADLNTDAAVSYATAETSSSADTIEVHVIATDRATNADVSVEKAEVKLYVGSELISTTRTDSDGIAKVSLAELSIEDRHNATISASKIVSRGSAINGTARDDLFNSFPRDINDEDGDGNTTEYYRYTMELHSETIDENGNWLGAEIPVSYESNKVDMVFAIDATGSMGNEINNVKNNVASFAENLVANGLDIRFSIIEYRDFEDSGEETIVHTLSGSHWMTGSDTVINQLQSIEVSGGGDDPETVIDALGYAADNRLMSWRSDAYRFAFVLTDANSKPDNHYGYANLSELAEKLAEMNVVTSVITSSSYRSHYSVLFDTTGGIYANIDSSNFEKEMQALADSIIETVTREMELKLSEPRMLVNMSVCYFADDKASQSDSYRESIKTMLNEYANRLAETTDGHILLDKVILFRTNNRVNFYTTSNIASMADIRIETEEKDDGKLLSNVQIHSNAHVTGFYSDKTYTAVYDGKNETEHFSNLKNGNDLDGKQSFYRIQMSGKEGAGWNYSLIDNAYKYSTTVMHETGHYLLGLFDEYLDANGHWWNDGDGKSEDDESQWTKPYPAYGLMDNQHTDIEMSKTPIDYAYMTEGFGKADISVHTNQSYNNKGSCEDSLATLLTDPNFTSYYYRSIISSSSFDLGSYKGTYSKVTSNDRTAGYTYAELSDSDFLTPSTSGSSGGGGSAWSLRASSSIASEVDAVFTKEPVANVSFVSGERTITATLSGKVGTVYSVSIMKAGDEDYTTVELTTNKAELAIARGEMAEVRVTANGGETVEYNTYYIDRSNETDVGYIYTSLDNAAMAYVTTDKKESYTFVADNTGYTNGEYRSVNQATRISSDNGIGFKSGEIYSVASYMAEIDYSTLTWFKYADGKWTALKTDYSNEETMNIGARADLAGEGLYVLMAKTAPVGTVKAAENLAYTQSADLDAVVHLTFDDPNTNSKYYNVYYSENAFTDKNTDGVVVRSFYADSTELTINLLERGRTVFAAVEIVLEDGSRSALSEIILIGGEADSDGDGIPDWYCDKYHLWGKDGEDKDIANSDDDGDGLTNLEEYQGGSDPTNPNDPVHTTNVAVSSVSISEEEILISVGGKKTVAALILPENATNKKVTWRTENASIASITATDGSCEITGVAEGTTKVYAVTEDGGYAAAVKVTVSNEVVQDPTDNPRKPSPVDIVIWKNPYTDVSRTDWFYSDVAFVSQNLLMNGVSADKFAPELATTRGMIVTILYRLKGEPTVYGECPFTDVKPGSYYENAITWAAANGIVTGYNATTFGPDDNITREQMAAILYRFTQYQGFQVGNTGALNFSDANAISDWAIAPMAWACKEGLISGIGNNVLNPQGNATRAQVAAILTRFCTQFY